MADFENVHVGIIGLILLIGGVALMESRGMLEGVGFLMMLAGGVMLFIAWSNRKK